MLKQNLQQKLLQKLSPQQIQTIKLLEIPIMQLEQRIKKELEDNPVLEETAESMESDSENDNSDISYEEYIKEQEERPYYETYVNNYSKDDKQKTIPISATVSFREHLEEQLLMRDYDEKQFTIAQYIIGCLDNDGYLRREVEAIVDDMAFLYGVETDEEEVEEALKMVQDLDPAGVGARDLRECLLLQISKKKDRDEIVEIAQKIIEKSFDQFTKKQYARIIKRFNITEDDLKSALDVIMLLYPKPGSSYSDSNEKSTIQIIPDFVLDENDGEFQLSLNSHNVPELRINSTYVDMLKSYVASKKSAGQNDENAVSFIKQKLDSAKWFIDAIKQRQTTLILTMNAIVDLQREYFKEGDDSKLRPMVLKDVADKTGLDVSTISRVVNSKHIQTHFGIFLLKYFFSESLQNDEGEDVSTREIKTKLQDAINSEDKRKPLNDEKITALLKEQGYNVARRTIAKYREQLNIPVARLRKEL